MITFISKFFFVFRFGELYQFTTQSLYFYIIIKYCINKIKLVNYIDSIRNESYIKIN